MAASSDLGETPLAGNRFTEVAVRRWAIVAIVALGTKRGTPGTRNLGTKHHGGVWWDAS